jgi:hypothetical protein
MPSGSVAGASHLRSIDATAHAHTDVTGDVVSSI